MRVSVVVPTYKRAESLARCLDALARQKRPAEEIIVVIRGGDVASQEVASQRPVRVVTVERAGVVAAMNAGLDACGGEVIALTDDDAAPHDDWLERIVETFRGDELIAAVGGRDFVYSYKTGQLIDGSESRVGSVNLFGRLIGNHHIGSGRARDVELLKGVNLSTRAYLLRRVRFDERLRGVGTEHHWELALCLTLRRLGYRVVYDSQIAVDHYPQPRVQDSRKFNPDELRDATHNRTVALLEYLPAWRSVLYLIGASVIGSRSAPGLVRMTYLLPLCKASWSLFWGAQAGLVDGLRTYLRSRRAASSL